MRSAQSATAADDAVTDGAASGMDSQAGPEGAIAPGEQCLSFKQHTPVRTLGCCRAPVLTYTWLPG